MARRHKRAHPSSFKVEDPRKRTKIDNEHVSVKHPTLDLYYVETTTLRDFLLSKLPSTSKTRRRKITSTENKYLDSILVSKKDEHQVTAKLFPSKDFEAFSQQINPTAISSIGDVSTSQPDLVDFAIWLLFNRIHRHAHRPPHMLCHGYQRANTPQRSNEDHCALRGIPGLVSHYPNSNVNTLKDATWTEVLGLLGHEGDSIMLDLLLNCGVFSLVVGGRGNHYQLSGTPMTDLQPLSASNITITPDPSRQNTFRKVNKDTCVRCNSPGSITFVRNRMFYARAALNAKGKVTFGLRHIHVLNRFSNAQTLEHTVHVMKYIFPKQFGLHNVFTSTVDPKETVQPFKDYTLREQEISQVEKRAMQKAGNAAINQLSPKLSIPRRLRGEAFGLVKKLQVRHSRCSYHALLNYHCPKPHSVREPFKPSLVSTATRPSDVSAFCRAAISKLIPNGYWGEGKPGGDNRDVVMKQIDCFIRLRRFENMSLHAVCQNIKIDSISWLKPDHIDPAAKVAMSDLQKRKELLQEFLYYVFDSLVIPLVRSNFHVTESNVHQNRLFYFRHDVWRLLTEPHMQSLKTSVFEEVKTIHAKKILEARALGFSQIRLLPKAGGLRPITNLRRRVTKLQNGKATLGRSINSVMAPVFNVLDYEKTKNPTLVGSALFSIGEMYPKLKSYAKILRDQNADQVPLYFAKADAKSCFDTLPQNEVVKLMISIAADDEYRIARHAEIKASDTHTYGKGRTSHVKPARKFISAARAASDFISFEEVIATHLANTKKETVFIDAIVQTTQKTRKLLDLLEDHVKRNIIKIGKKFFRQKAGIPQGSVLSSLLCNYFYADLERETFGFLQDSESILLRLIDDFLLITTNKSHAQKFLQIMHDGIESYGVEVNPAKSLANFETSINGQSVPQLKAGTAFPYCGSTVDTRTLEIMKDRDRRRATVLADTLTVESSKTPGKTFYRKALCAFKIQTHRMFLDTSFNSPTTVLMTIYQNFMEASMKYYRYAKSMGKKRQPHLGLIMGTITDLVDLAFVLIQGKHKSNIEAEYACAVSKCQVQCNTRLAMTAFRSILGRKQSKYHEVIAWLDVAIENSAPKNRTEASRLNRIAKQGEVVFRGYKY